MSKFTKRLSIVVALLCLALSFNLYGCKKTPATESSSPEPENTKYILVDGGVSDYSIVIPDECAGSESAAANNIAEFINQAASCELPVYTENSYSGGADKRVISIGETKLYKNSGLNYDKSKFNGDGYAIKTVDGNVYIIAGEGQNAYAFAALQFLHEAIGFEAYTFDEVYFNKNKTVKLKELDLTDVPDFRYRNAYNGNVLLCDNPTLQQLYYRISEMPKSSYDLNHNVYKYLPPEVYAEIHPEWYTAPDNDNGQICWSNKDLQEELAVQVINHILSEESVDMFMIGQNDFGTYWCRCAECNRLKMKYGTDAAAECIALKLVCKRVQEYFDKNGITRKVKVGIFAYQSSEKPPAIKTSDGNYQPIDDAVVLPDNAFVMLAPINSDYSCGYDDPKNESTRDNIYGWKTLCKNFLIWGYDANFSHFLIPFSSYDAMPQMFKTFKEMNTVRLWQQGSYNSKTAGFRELRNYITAKLLWNVDADMNLLIDEFFDNYYKDGSVYMKRFFNEYRNWLKVLEKRDGSVHGGVYMPYTKVVNAFPQNLLDRWEEYIDAAKREIEYLKGFDDEQYELMYSRFDRETIFFDYIRIFVYGADYGTDELYELRTGFKYKCEKYDITRISENEKVSDVCTSWGV